MGAATVPWAGLFAVLDEPAVPRLMSAAALLAAVNVTFLSILFWVYDRPGMAALQAAFIALHLGTLWLTVKSPRSRLAGMVSVWVSLPGVVLGHVIMGGYLYSGGYLLFGIGCVVLALAESTVCALPRGPHATALLGLIERLRSEQAATGR